MIAFDLKLKTKNLTNERSHWSVKAKRAKTERAAVMLKCPKWTSGALLVVTMVRYGTRDMDDDGLRAALKGVRDGVASRLRVDDGSGLVSWRYEQQRCKAGEEHVAVSIQTVAEKLYEPRVTP